MRNHLLLIYVLLVVFLVLQGTFCLAEEEDKNSLEFLSMKEYYFPLNQPSQLVLNVSNPYDLDLKGMMTYTISQTVQTGGTFMQSTNSNSQEFIIGKDQKEFGLNLGGASAPGEMIITLQFDYSDPDGKKMQTTLDEIKVYFVDEQEQQEQEQQEEEQQEQEQQKSDTKSQEELKKEYEKQQEEAEKQHEEEMKEQIRQQQEASKLQNRMQNNQQHQDTRALKQQMQQEMEEKQKMQDEFKKALEQNSEFQEKMMDLMDQGYNLTGAELDAQNSTSGDFKVNFQDQQGNNLTLSGNMENNNITEMRETKKISDENLRKLVDKDSRFKELDEMLRERGFNQDEWLFNSVDNETTVMIEYIDDVNKTKEIKAEIKDYQVVKVELINGDWLYYLLLILVVVLLLVALGYWSYHKYHKKDDDGLAVSKKEKPFDYRREALKLLYEAKIVFVKNEHKEAYSKASQAIRIYYSYKIGLKKEITNTDLIKVLKRKDISYVDTQKCLNLCTLVEFAKYHANKKDFDEIIRLGEEIIK